MDRSAGAAHGPRSRRLTTSATGRNPLTKTIGAATETITYSAASNRIDTLTPASGPPRTFQFDANGSTLDDGQKQLAYDPRERLIQAVTTAGTTTYQVNALGQRIAKTDGAAQTVFFYDTRGKLSAETDAAGAAGAAKRELIYHGDIPVGVIQ